MDSEISSTDEHIYHNIKMLLCSQAKFLLVFASYGNSQIEKKRCGTKIKNPINVLIFYFFFVQ